MNSETIARVVAALAENDGLLTVTSATKSGIDKSLLARAADESVLVRTARGKYADPKARPRPLALRGAYIAGDGALSHRGGGSFWAMDGVGDSILEWSVPHSVRSSSPLIHRRRRFADLDLVLVNGVLVTSPAQTLADLGAVCGADIVERAVESVLRNGLATDAELREFATSEARARHGGPMLRAVLERRPVGARPTGSDVETIALQIYRRDGLRPTRQWEVLDEVGELIGYGDFGFPPKALVVEMDGLGTHDLENRQHDYDRQGRIEDRGYRVRRFTREDVLRRPRYLCAATRRALTAADYL